ncbi:MAG: DUF3037 domain-containing protein [Acidobacteriaceae bacterium]
MSDRQPFEFFLVRYVPDPVKDEFVNIGVLLRDAAQPDSAQVRFTKDWGRVRCVDPDADVAMLEAMEAEMQRRLVEDSAPLMRTIEDSFSHQLQMTQPKACLAENMAAEMEELMRLYVEPRKEKARQALSGRQAIVRQMRMHFEHARVWELMRKRIVAAEYTRPGDSLKIDCGYRPNGVIRMFHAVSLEGDVELAKVLAFSAPALRAGITRVENAELELTAVVEPLRDSNGEVPSDADAAMQYRFGVETMEAQQIRVLTVSDLERVADTARRELRV